MAKKTKNLNLPIISSDEYSTTRVVDMINDIQGDKVDSAFNIIDSAINSADSRITEVETELSAKQDKIQPNSYEEGQVGLTNIKIDGVVYKLNKGITEIDNTLSADSENPVQNKVIFNALSNCVTTQEAQRMIEEAIRYSLETEY